MGNLDVGRAGEDFACRYLIAKGYAITARNYRSGHLETDIVCENGEYILFVEVKSRVDTGKPSRYGRPGNACDYKKRQNLRLCAEAYLRTNKTNKKPRIDVIEVYLRRMSGVCVLSDKGIRHIENAFL
jgi:putative endonuclease